MGHPAEKEADWQPPRQHTQEPLQLTGLEMRRAASTWMAGLVVRKLGRVTHEPAEIQLHPRPPESSIQRRAALAALLLLAAMSR